MVRRPRHLDVFGNQGEVKPNDGAIYNDPVGPCMRACDFAQVLLFECQVVKAEGGRIHELACRHRWRRNAQLKAELPAVLCSGQRSRRR